MKVGTPKAIDGGLGVRAADVNMEEAAVFGWEEGVQSAVEEELYAASEVRHQLCF